VASSSTCWRGRHEAVADPGGETDTHNEDVVMKWNAWIRRAHRWISVVFVTVVIMVTIASSGEQEPAEWVYLSPLLPLALLAITGIYLFALPYVTKWRAGRRDAGGQQ
jgi:hypothetical protein